MQFKQRLMDVQSILWWHSYKHSEQEGALGNIISKRGRETLSELWSSWLSYIYMVYDAPHELVRSEVMTFSLRYAHLVVWWRNILVLCNKYIYKLEKLVFINSDKTLGLQIQLLKTNAMKTKYFYKYMPDADVCFLAVKH